MSADSTDPSANATTPADSTRNLYLWMTCSTGGAAAIEADVSGSLPIISFNTLNGVLNAGGATNLLLAVPGCPTGPGVNLLLGFWQVADTGGGLCLGPSASNGRFGVVDCSQNLWTDPEVTGFSSTGSAPCSVGTNGCGPASQEPLSAEFIEAASYSGSFPHRMPWSPSTPLLVFNAPDGLTVLDAGQLGQRPRRIMVAQAEYIDWSPDGQWLLCRTQDLAERRRGRASLCAVPLDGRAKIDLVQHQNIGHVLWSQEGSIYYWEQVVGTQHRIDAPAAWRAENPGPFPARDRLVLVHDPASGRLTLRQLVEREGLLEVPAFDLGLDQTSQVYYEDRFPAGDRFLLQVNERGKLPYSIIVDRAGQVLTNFGEYTPEHGFTATSVSPDGAFVLGHHDVDNSESIESSTLYVADPSDKWRVPVKSGPMAYKGYFSRVGDHTAYQDLEGRIHVGRIQFSYR